MSTTKTKERLATKESFARARQKSVRMREELACELELHATVRRLGNMKFGSEAAIVEEAVRLWLQKNPIPKHLLNAAKTLMGKKGGES